MKKQYSVQRLRYLYRQLLHYINIQNDELYPRGYVEEYTIPVDDDDNDPSNSNTISTLQNMIRSLITLKNHTPKNNHTIGQVSKQRNHNNISPEELHAAFRMMAAMNIYYNAHHHDTTTSSKETKIDVPLIDSNNHDDHDDDHTMMTTPSKYVQKIAHQIEDTVIQIIQEIGTMIIYTQQQYSITAVATTSSSLDHTLSGRTTNIVSSSTLLPCDDVWAYFCEKAIFIMLVEMMLEQPCTASNSSSSTHHTNITSQQQHTTGMNGVVWSAKVKGQILISIQQLLYHIHTPTTICYLLSQNCLNYIIQCIFPIQQWDVSLFQNHIVHPYIELLKTLCMVLSSSIDLFPFFIIPQNDIVTTTCNNHTNTDNHNSNDHHSIILFPLYTAIVQMVISSYAQNDSYIHASCLNLVIGLYRISDIPIRNWMNHPSHHIYHEPLLLHINDQLIIKYQRLVQTMNGPIVDHTRSKSLVFHINTFYDQIDFINDLFDCTYHTLNKRLCEIVLHGFIRTMIHDILPGMNQSFLIVGVSDYDVIPTREGTAQIATYCIAQLLSRISYRPLLRIIAVTIFHPLTTKLWKESIECHEISKHYGTILLSTLNQIVQDDDDTIFLETIPNIYRNEILNGISGMYGEWRLITTTAVIEHMITTLDDITLIKLQLLPNHDGTETISSSSSSVIEEPMMKFFNQHHTYKSSVSYMAIECMVSLALKYIIKYMTSLFTNNQNNSNNNVPIAMKQMNTYIQTSSLIHCIRSTRNYFHEQVLHSIKSNSNTVPMNDITIKLLESIVQSRYKRTVQTNSDTTENTDRHQQQPRIIFVYNMIHYGPNTYCSSSSGNSIVESLIRSIPGQPINDIEVLRFHSTMAIHFYAVMNVVQRLSSDVIKYTPNQPSSAALPSTNAINYKLYLVDEAPKELLSTFCCLHDVPIIGSDLDLRNHTYFPFTVHKKQSNSNQNIVNGQQYECNNSKIETVQPRIRTLSDDMILRETSTDLFVVFDTMNLFVVKSDTRMKKQQRGMILCIIPLLDIIATAMDDDRLHIAVLEHTNVGCLIKNGNMILSFDNSSTCHIVHQYVDQCRCMLRQTLLNNIITLFSEGNTTANNSNTSICDHPVDSDIPHAKTF